MQAQGSTGDQAAQQSLANILGQGPQTPSGATQVTIAPPSAGGEEGDSDVDSEEEEEDRPLSREELKARTLKGLSRREGKEKKSKGARGSKSQRKKPSSKGYDDL